MKKLIESDAIVLAAGKQTRYKMPESKLMARIDSKPAFFYTVSNILQVIPEEFVTIISSSLFQDFNDYISHNFQDIQLVLDQNPGSGSAQTLKLSMPWRTELALVSEGNIYFESFLINQMLHLMQANPDLLGMLSITPKIDVASTHRRVSINNGLDLSGSSLSTDIFKNMGAYVLRDTILKEVSNTPDIIEVLNILNISGQPIAALDYYGCYLHMETPNDIPSWQSHLSGKLI